MSRMPNSLDPNSSHNSIGRRLVRRVQDDPDTQRSLQEASAALETAFDHIRHVQRNLLRLTESFPEPLTTTTTTSSNFEQDSINPGHEALVLTDDAGEEQENDVSNDRTIAQDTQVVNGATGSPPRPSRPHSSVIIEPPARIQAPPLPRVLPPRFTRQNIYGFTALSPDSAATTHGLRVAAREGANSTTNNIRVAPNREARSAELESLARRRMGFDVGYWEDVVPRSAIRDISSLPVLPPASRPSILYPFYAPPPDPSNRVNYLPLPPVPVPSFQRPIQRPLRDLPGPPRPPTVNESIPVTEDAWLLSLTEYARSLRPRRDPLYPDNIRIARVHEPILSHPSEPRRRGWARLDADGNEIPWDEEEELERSRTEYRLRVLQGAQEDPEIPRHDGRAFHGSVLDSMLSLSTTRPRTPQWRTPPPTDNQGCSFWVDPLPMPLSSMTMKEERQEHPDVIVPRHACLAGR